MSPITTPCSKSLATKGDSLRYEGLNTALFSWGSLDTGFLVKISLSSGILLNLTWPKKGKALVARLV